MSEYERGIKAARQAIAARLEELRVLACDDNYDFSYSNLTEVEAGLEDAIDAIECLEQALREGT